MRESTVHTAWKSGRHVLNGWLSIANSFSAELMAKAGWDSITIDLQHGLIDYQAAVGMMQAIATTSTASLVRVPWNDPAIIDRKSTRLNSSHVSESRMPSSA